MRPEATTHLELPSLDRKVLRRPHAHLVRDSDQVPELREVDDREAFGEIAWDLVAQLDGDLGLRGLSQTDRKKREVRTRREERPWYVRRISSRSRSTPDLTQMRPFWRVDSSQSIWGAKAQQRPLVGRERPHTMSLIIPPSSLNSSASILASNCEELSTCRPLPEKRTHLVYDLDSRPARQVQRGIPHHDRAVQELLQPSAPAHPARAQKDAPARSPATPSALPSRWPAREPSWAHS